MYLLMVLLHYVPALIYVVHKLAVHFSIKNILVTTVSFVLFPMHFMLTLYYKIMFSLMIAKINKSEGEEATSLLSKIKPDNPLNTFIILFTCVQIPFQLILQIIIYLAQYRHVTNSTILIVLNLILCLLLFTNGVVSYFRYETQNINKYLLGHVNLKATNGDKVKVARTYKKPEPSSQRSMAQFEVERQDRKVVIDAHTLPFKVIVFLKWLLHNYIRIISIAFVLFYFPTFTLIFFTVQTIVSFLALLFCDFKSQRKLSIAYDLLQSVLLNVCLIEYRLNLCQRKLLFVGYFLIVFAENLLFNYLWYFTANWSRRQRGLFNATLWSLIVCQILHFVLMIVYFVFYKPKQFEINYNAGTDEEEGDGDDSSSENEDENVPHVEENGFQSSGQRYENVNGESSRQSLESTRQSLERKKTNNVDRIRTNIPVQTNGRKTPHKAAFDNLIYTETEKQRPVSKYKELVNDPDEQTVYSKTQSEERKSKSLTTSSVSPEQRESWKYIVEEIDDQIHKSTGSLHKTKLHLSSDRLNRKFNRSTDSLDSEARASTSREQPQKGQQMYQLQKDYQPYQKDTPRSLFETTHTKSYKHIKHGTGDFSEGTNVDPDDVEDVEEIIMENRNVDANFDRRTSRYSSQEFVETRRVDEKTYEERKMNLKTMNTTSLV
ncbi:hypothetical protein M8J76_003857 [Diaphorina citri]|nr:hypothetical protein M8J75_010158 [Diaphorina citri]KAI5722110.1 hypothetical protein M8J76_003857 [Diaphorina citri]